MTHEEYDVMYKKMYEEECSIHKTKGKEYSTDADRLANFKKLAEETGVSDVCVCWIFLKKHLDSIASFVRTGKEFSEESIYSRIKDARIYLALMRALIEDGKKIH